MMACIPFTELFRVYKADVLGALLFKSVSWTDGLQSSNCFSLRGAKLTVTGNLAKSARSFHLFWTIDAERCSIH